MEDWAAFYSLEFPDGGDVEGGLICLGSEQDCMLVLDRIPAIAYSGPRLAPQATMYCMPLSEIPEKLREAWIQETEAAP
jgi:hypothetical protein